MQSYIDLKYVNIISPYLQQFKKKGDFLWNFSFVRIIGDSQNHVQNPEVSYIVKNDLFYKCHNCGVGTTLGKIQLSWWNSKTYKDYILERYKKGVKTNNPEVEWDFNDAPVFRKKDILKGLQSIEQLDETHPAKIILCKRKLPKENLADIFLCPSFFAFTNKLIPNKFSSLGGDHPRLLIPFRNKEGEIFAYQGRAFGKETPKYITIKLDEDDKIYGLDKVDNTKQIYVVEGPIDSMFLDNCIAVGG